MDFRCWKWWILSASLLLSISAFPFFCAPFHLKGRKKRGRKGSSLPKIHRLASSLSTFLYPTFQNKQSMIQVPDSREFCCSLFSRLTLNMSGLYSLHTRDQNHPFRSKFNWMDDNCWQEEWPIQTVSESWVTQSPKEFSFVYPFHHQKSVKNILLSSFTGQVVLV